MTKRGRPRKNPLPEEAESNQSKDETETVDSASQEDIEKVDTAEEVEKTKVTELPACNQFEKLFEAPDGEIVAGPKEANRLFHYSKTENKRIWINPRR